MRRNHHPYMSSTYINGYVKDQPLRSMQDLEILDEFQKFNSTFGRTSLKHNSIKVSSFSKSIQGGWQANLWQTYPKHTMELKKALPYVELE